MTIEAFERELMKIILAGDDPILVTLREQYKASVVTTREFTGVGCYTNFGIPTNTPLVSPANFEIDDVGMELQGVEHGAVAVLFVRDGKIDFLEMVTIIGQWPNDLILESITYVYNEAVRSPTTTTERDLDALRNSWLLKFQRKS